MADSSGTEANQHPGGRLGLPADGPGSVASWSRRLAALAVDWVASMLVALLFLGEAVMGQGSEAWAPMAVFWAEKSLLTVLLSGSFGQLVLRLVVVRIDDRPVNLLQAMLRSALVCLVVPPLITNRDRRGLHDLVVGTVTLRR